MIAQLQHLTQVQINFDDKHEPRDFTLFYDVPFTTAHSFGLPVYASQLTAAGNMRSVRGQRHVIGKERTELRQVTRNVSKADLRKIINVELPAIGRSLSRFNSIGVAEVQ